MGGGEANHAPPPGFAVVALLRPQACCAMRVNACRRKWAEGGQAEEGGKEAGQWATSAAGSAGERDQL
eukprot:5096689-Pyramimonas_sp.AAC.1